MDYEVETNGSEYECNGCTMSIENEMIILKGYNVKYIFPICNICVIVETPDVIDKKKGW
jgi:hypothetical protein